MTKLNIKTRSIDKIATAHQTREGNFEVNRPLPSPGINNINPFLMLDNFGPTAIKPGEQGGVGEHPHRGFETVTYLLSGEIEHKDSSGGQAIIKAGQVQWMTAGSGLVHSELHSPEFTQKGGVIHGLQLWVNLPKKDKMTTPHYKILGQDDIISFQKDEITVRIIAGELDDHKSTTKTHTPVNYFHLTLPAGTQTELKIPHTHNSFAYIISGRGEFGEDSQKAKSTQLVLFKNDGETVQIKNTETENLEVILLSGEPIHEPIASYGPFVMNSFDEIYEAINDYQMGRMGSL
jgi:redox-sensitive bicupin YhaK (pirin superfamily)